MLKPYGQHQEGAPLSQNGKMTDAEYAAFSEAFDEVKGDYQTHCLISDKLREVETTARGLGSLDLWRVVNEITPMCKKVARLGSFESLAELAPHVEKQGRGVRV